MKNKRGSFAAHLRFVSVIALLLAGTAAIAQETPANIPADESTSPGHMRPSFPPAQVGRPEILSDTMGVNFGLYLHMNLMRHIRENWQSAVTAKGLKPPTERQAIVAEFTVLKDGTLDGLKLAESSGDAELDHTALDAIAKSAPFAALPDEFKGPSIKLRCPLHYGPGHPMQIGQGTFGAINAADQAASQPEIGPNGETIYKISRGNGVTAPRVTYQTEPEFSDQARRDKVQGVVVLTLVVTPDGTPTDIKVTHPLGSGLDETAVEAVKQWRFKPGTKDGNPVAVRITVETDFHL